MEIGTIIAIIGAAVGAISGIGALVQQSRRDRLEGETSLSAATLALLRPYQDEVEKLRKEIEPLKQRITELEIKLDEVIEGAHRLAMQIRKNGDEPVWQPPGYEVKKK